MVLETFHHDHEHGMTQRVIEARLNSMDISELIGLCKGVLADGTVNLDEADFILQWLEEYSEVLHLWPANVLHRNLTKMLEEGTLNERDQRVLNDLLTEITGGPVSVLYY